MTLHPATRLWAFVISLLIGLLCLCSPARADWQQGEYRILRAEYGTADRHIDVTDRLKELAQRDERFRLGNNIFGTDPDRGHAKVLRIEAVSGSGRNRTFEYTEGSWVDGSMFEGWRGGNWGQGGDSSGWNRPGYHDGGSGEYRITQARYGTSRHNVDVTGRLRELARGDERFRLSNSTFGVDPDRGKLKTLRIYAEGPRGARTFEYTEGSWVDGAQFSGWSGGNWGQGGRGSWGGDRPNFNGYDSGSAAGSYTSGLQILSAEYGSNDNRIDITHRVQRRVFQNRLNVKVDNDLAGDDPAEGRAKKLWITYSVDGRETRRNVREGDRLMLP